MIISNICLNPLGFRRLFSHDCDPHAIKVVYGHTRIASYRRWHVENVGKHIYGYWLLMVGLLSKLGVFQVTLFCPIHAEQGLIIEADIRPLEGTIFDFGF